MLEGIKDMSKYTLFIFPDLLGFKVWIERNYTFENVCADSNDKSKVMRFFYKTMYMMSVFECLYVYIQALAKVIGRELLTEDPSSSENLDSLFSILDCYKNERERIGALIASLIRNVMGDGVFENTYRSGISARLSKKGISREKILLFDIMIRILFIMDKGDSSYFTKRKSHVKDNTPLINFVEAHSFSGEGIGMEKFKSYIERYSSLLDEQLEIRDKNPLKDLTIDEGNMLKNLEYLRETLLEVNWTIMTSNIIVKRLPGFRSVIEGDSQ
jgi:hypothetical protein